MYAVAAELDEWLLTPRNREGDSGSRPVAETIADSEEPRSEVIDQPAQAAGDRIWKAYALAAFILLLCVGTLAWARAKGHHAARQISLKQGKQSEDLLEADVALELRTADSLRRAIALYSEHIHQNPNSAEAYAGLAKAYCLLREYSSMTSETAYPLAQKAAQRALTLDPENADANSVLGFVNFFWLWDVSAAERNFQDAIHAAPSSALPRQWYGSMLLHEGKLSQALEQLEEAQRLAPSSVAIVSLRALAISLAGDRSRAISILEDLERYFPTAPAPHRTLAYISLQTPRDPERFLLETSRFAELKGDTDRQAEIRAATAVLRKHGESAMWEFLLSRERSRPDALKPSLWIAQLEAITGEEDAAVAEATAVVRQHDEGSWAVLIDPSLGALRQKGRLRAAVDMLPNR